jgi:hypothetical protein
MLGLRHAVTYIKIKFVALKHPVVFVNRAAEI